MKNKILIVLILILNSKAKAQLQVVTTNTVEHITYLSKIQNMDEDFQSYMIIVFICLILIFN
jgi:hypothetical protein